MDHTVLNIGTSIETSHVFLLRRRLLPTSILSLFSLLALYPTNATAQFSRKRPVSYTSPDQAFSLLIPKNFSVYTGDAIPNAPSGTVPICRRTAAVCVAYVGTRYAGTTFAGAAFGLTMTDEKTKEDCLAATGMNSQSQPATIQQVSGIPFAHIYGGDGAAGTQVLGDDYAGWVRQRCYEIRINIEFGEFKNYDPGTIKEFTSRDQEMLLAKLRKIRDSLVLRP